MTFVLGYKQSPEHTAKIRAANLGRKRTPEFCQLMSRIQRGKKLTEEHRARLRERSRWRVSSSQKIKTWKRKLSERFSGSANVNWNGGICGEEYGHEFSWELKEYIRQRDGRICRLCGQCERGRKHDVHHIDYNKKNNEPNNLITLCLRCHRKTGANRRYWMERLRRILCRAGETGITADL